MGQAEGTEAAKIDYSPFPQLMSAKSLNPLLRGLSALVLLLTVARAAPVTATVVEKKNPLKTMADKAAGAPTEPVEVVPVPLPEPPPTLYPVKVAAATPAPAAPAPTAKKPEFSTGEKPNLLLAKRTERRFTKLREWAARLDAKKAALKTPLQIEAFNEEAAKYHAELTAARQEAALAQK